MTTCPTQQPSTQCCWNINSHIKITLTVNIGVDVKFPMPMWDKLIKQSNITFNLLRQSKVHPHLLAWAH